MGGETQHRVSPHLIFALAGLESGVLGAGIMLLWLFATSLLLSITWWAFPNLLAAVLYRNSALRAGFGIQSVVGTAVLILMAGAIGALFGLLVGGHRSRLRVALLAILTALVWFYLSQTFFWNRLGVIARIHVPPLWTMTGYLAYGFVLASYPRRRDAVWRHFEPPAAPGESPPPPPEARVTDENSDTVAPPPDPGSPRNPMVE